LSLGSCVAENPFEKADGDGILRSHPTFKGDVTVSTREGAVYDQATLENNLVVYVERKGTDGGLVRKFIGKSQIPSSISLKEGDYVVEAWTGDSVSASWDKKFYRAYEDNVKIEAATPNQLTLKCNIANVLVSVMPESLEAGVTDLKVSFWHSRKGTDNEYVLEFGQTEIENQAKGYFMMPTVNHTTGEKEKVINYLITGKADDGSEFTKEGTLDNVSSAHEYRLKVVADAASAGQQGGALVRLEIVDVPLIEATVDVFPAPVYEAYYAGGAFDISNQIVLTSGINTLDVTTVAYGGVKGFTLTFSENFNAMLSQQFGTLNGRYSVSLINDEDARTKFAGIGLVYDRKTKEDNIAGTDGDKIQVDEVYLTFSPDFLAALPVSDTEYVITIDANDGRYNSSSAKIRFANSDAAIEREAPVGTPDMNRVENQDFTAITPYSATLYGEIYTDDAANYGIKYRESGTSNWTEVPASDTRAEVKKYSVNISNLKPGTVYEYKAYCDDFEEQGSRTFTTESLFTIPNAGLEEWSNLSSNSKVLIPAAGGSVSFWDTGNHGSATMSKLVTNQSDALKHGGNYSAELKSQFVGIGSIGKFAAGNLFVGSYDKTDGTDGELTFGRPYNGSHPKALTLYANYRPGTGVAKKGADSNYIAEGATDEGQIYVALTSEPVSIKTKTKQLFDANADYVVAYGQITWTGDFGADGSLDKVTIPLEYTSRAKTTKPTHLVIVCSASKYGDFFSGGEGSLLYVDDFELEY
ncbi:MAG: PCMD domain-containing protein, partial [Muribaculaceae bacterium]|nr:PCMD domain-containing protein [Muribaculaceae bacterium]